MKTKELPKAKITRSEFYLMLYNHSLLGLIRHYQRKEGIDDKEACKRLKLSPMAFHLLLIGQYTCKLSKMVDMGLIMGCASDMQFNIQNGFLPK